MLNIRLTPRQELTFELAFAIEDPAGIEAVKLAQVILDVFEDREPVEAASMRESLLQWASQWPRGERRQATNDNQDDITQPDNPQVV